MPRHGTPCLGEILLLKLHATGAMDAGGMLCLQHCSCISGHGNSCLRNNTQCVCNCLQGPATTWPALFSKMYICLLLPGEWHLCLWTVVCLPSHTAFSVASSTGRKSCCCCARVPWFSPVPVLRHPTPLAFVPHSLASSFFSFSFYDSSSLSLFLSLSFSFFPSLSLFPTCPAN